MAMLPFRVRGLIVGACAAAVLAGCTGSDGATESPSAQPSATAAPSNSVTPSAPALTLDEVVTEVLEPERPKPIASTSGEAKDMDNSMREIEAEVYEITASPRSTVVSFALRAGSTEEYTRDSFALSDRAFYMEGFEVVDPGSGRRLEPYLEDGDGYYFTCTRLPKTLVDAWYDMTCLVPPLDPATTEVDVVLPDLGTIDSVPVTRVSE